MHFATASKRKRTENDSESNGEKSNGASQDLEPQLKKLRPVAPLPVKPQPTGIEDLKKMALTVQKDDKPVFMTPSMRKKLAEEEEALLRQQEQEKQKAINESRDSFFKQAESEKRQKDRGSRSSSSYRRRDDSPPRRGGSSRRRRDDSPRRRSPPRRDDDRRDSSRGDRRRHDDERESERDGSSRRRQSRDESPPREKEAEPLTEKEKELIKAQYLNTKKEKKKVIKPSEKFNFRPSWDPSEDTSYDLNPLYSQRHAIKPLCSSKRDPLEAKVLKRNVQDLHWSEKGLEQMTERDWRIFKEDFSIVITGGGSLPHPMRNWEESPLPTVLKQTVEEIGYRKPTPIQMAAIPVAIQGRDILGVAQTGSGKTAAFLLPLLVHISKLPPMTQEIGAQGPYALILAPTRDLVLQIHAETEKFAAKMKIRSTAIVGGKSIQEQAHKIGAGCEIVIATPNRLLDCLERRFIVFNQCYYIILDEADEMISNDFEPQLLKILEAMPESRWKSTEETEAEKQEQDVGKYCTVNLFSATMPAAIERLSRKYLRRPASINIESDNPLSHIEQRVHWTQNEGDKKRLLLSLLQDEKAKPPIMVFANRKNTCDMLSDFLEELGFKSIVLHSGKNQEQREHALNSFRQGKYDILISTMGRGIDVEGVTHAILFDVPDSIEEYTHRIGRTGRAGKTGIAVAYVTPSDTAIMFDLKKMLQKTGHPVPRELKNHPASMTKQAPGAPSSGRPPKMVH